MSETQWYFIDGAGEKQGPYKMAEIQAYAGEGMINNESLLWYEGLQDWSPAGHFPDIAPYLAPAVAATAQANPYLAPQTGVLPGAPLTAAPVGGDYPFPAVKAASFGKYLSFLLGGFALLALGFILIFVAAADSVNNQSPSITTIEQSPSGSKLETTNTPAQEPPAALYAGMGFMGLGYVLMIVGSILGIIYIYRAWFTLQPGGAQSTPGKAVGFLFIPVFNLYWIFVAYPGWAKDWNRIRQSYSNLSTAPSVSEGLFLAMPICIICSAIPFLGLFILPVSMLLNMICIKKMTEVVNFVSTNNRRIAMAQGGAGMSFY